MNDAGHALEKRAAELTVVTMAHALLASRAMRRTNINQAATEVPLPTGQLDTHKAWLAEESGTDGRDT